MITLLNTSILTSFGSYSYLPTDVGSVRKLLAENEWQSAIGHQSTADVLSELLDIKVPVNRIAYEQDVNDIAVVFKLNSRAPEGVILSKLEIIELGYHFGLLKKLS